MDEREREREDSVGLPSRGDCREIGDAHALSLVQPDPPPPLSSHRHRQRTAQLSYIKPPASGVTFHTRSTGRQGEMTQLPPAKRMKLAVPVRVGGDEAASPRSRRLRQILLVVLFMVRV
jgi:hypothetical protein